MSIATVRIVNHPHDMVEMEVQVTASDEGPRTAYEVYCDRCDTCSLNLTAQERDDELARHRCRCTVCGEHAIWHPKRYLLICPQGHSHEPQHSELDKEA